MEVRFVGGESTKITIDSGAEENVCPWEWGEQLGIHESVKKVNFRGASGHHIKHHGQRGVQVKSPF